MLSRLFCFVSLLYGVGFATPLLILLANPDDIPIDVPVFALVSITVVLALAGGLHVLAARISASDVPARLALTVALVLAVQGNIVNDLFHFGEFNGQPLDLRGFGWTFWLEWFGYLLAFPLFYWGLARFRPIPAWLALLPVISSTCLVVPALFEARDRPPPAKVDTVVDPEVFNFSGSLNLLHLLPDGFQGDIAREVLERHPDLARRLSGFTFYRNHLASYDRTLPSVPVIFTGRPFDLVRGVDYRKLARDLSTYAYTARLQENGFRVDYVTFASPFCLPSADTCVMRPFGADFKPRGYLTSEDTGRVSLGLLMDVTLFRHSPMFLKERIYDNGHWWMAGLLSARSTLHPDPVLREWIEKMKVVDGPPRYKWYHYIGTHYPPQWDADCNYLRDLEWTRENFAAQSYCVLDGIAALVDKLREEGILDRTAIIVTGDHGVNVPPDDSTGRPANFDVSRALTGLARPVLMIRPLDAGSTPLRYSDTPTSLQDVAPTALDLVGLQGDYPGRAVSKIGGDRLRPRTFRPLLRNARTVARKPVSFDTFEVTGPANDLASWALTGMFRTSPAPSRYDRMDPGAIAGFSRGLVHPEGGSTDFAWIGGTRMAVLVYAPVAGDAAKLALSLGPPPTAGGGARTFTVAVNRVPLGGTRVLAQEEEWTALDLEVPPGVLVRGNNLVTVSFSSAAGSEDAASGQPAARIRSLRLDTGRSGAPAPPPPTAAAPPRDEALPVIASAAEAAGIIQAYGEALQKVGSAGEMLVHPATALPYAKSRIEAALFFMLDRAGDPGQRNFLETAIRLLATFQEGVVDDVTDLDAKSPDGRTWRAVVEDEMLELSDEIAARGQSKR